MFGSASGCNFYSFNGSFDSNFVTSFISKLSEVLYYFQICILDFYCIIQALTYIGYFLVVYRIL